MVDGETRVCTLPLLPIEVTPIAFVYDRPHSLLRKVTTTTRATCRALLSGMKITARWFPPFPDRNPNRPSTRFLHASSSTRTSTSTSSRRHPQPHPQWQPPQPRLQQRLQVAPHETATTITPRLSPTLLIPAASTPHGELKRRAVSASARLHRSHWNAHQWQE